MSYRSDLDALRARHDALESEVASRQHELLETRRMIDEVQRRARLPVLDNIRVAAPCSADWAAMSGDERVRACGACNKNVYNLSGMTREEAQALILEKEGRLCVRYYRRADGTILFNDCELGASRRRRRRLVATAAALLATTAAAGTAFRMTTPEMGGMEPGYVQGGLAEPAPEPTMGLVAMPPEVEMGKVAEEPAPEPVMGDISGEAQLQRQEQVRRAKLEAEQRAKLEAERRARALESARARGSRRGGDPR